MKAMGSGSILRRFGREFQTLSEQEERELIFAARQGDTQAFDCLVRQYDRLVLSQALNFTRDRDRAMDIYQEVFLRANRGLGSFRFDCRFATWLRKITANVCMSEYAKQRIREKRVITGGQLGGTGTDGENDWNPVDYAESTEPDSYRQAVSREIRGRIEQTIKELPPQQRMVFVLRHYEGQKLKDIADYLEIATGTAKKHLFMAIQKMRESLREFQGVA